MLIVELDRRAVLASLDVVGAIPSDRWTSPTPCASWNLGELVAHMTAQHHGFAAAAAGRSDLADWALRPLGSSPRDDYAASVRAVLDAFAADGILDRDFSLPEISTESTVPGGQAVGFHLVDYVLHGWDVAVAVGLPWSLDDDVVEAALTVSEVIPTGDARELPGAPFGPAVPSSSGATEFDRLLALTGRSPSWAPS